MAYDANMTSIAKSMRSIALVFWCFFWLTVASIVISLASWLVLMAEIQSDMRQAMDAARRAQTIR